MSHEHARTPPARVRVNDTTIPVINEGVRTELRKDGAMDITRHSEVYFPIEWQGNSYRDTVEALDPSNRNVYDPVDIDIRDEVTGEYVTVHRGFVMGVGGGAEGTVEHRMTVGDVGQLLGAIPFEASYESDATLDDIVRDVVDTLEARISPQVFPSIDLKASSDISGTVDSTVPIIGDIVDQTPRTILTPLVIDKFGTKEFNYHEHTLSDALSYVSDRVDGAFSFEPDGNNGVALTYDEGIDRTFRATHLGDDGDVRVLANNALHEIKPLNMVTVNGRIDTGIRSSEYAYATAFHEPLYERSQIPLEHVESGIEADSIDELQAIAANTLRKKLDSASLGQIVTDPAPAIRPYNDLLSRPACGQQVESGPPLTFEVESVVHNIRAKPSDDHRRRATQIRAAVSIDGDDIITPPETAGYRETDDVETNLTIPENAS